MSEENKTVKPDLNTAATPEKTVWTRDMVIKEILSWALVVVVAFILAELITSFVIMKAEIISESMVPGLLKDDHVIGNRLSYLFSDPERGDVVFFEYPKSDKAMGKNKEVSTVFVKRIIGLPGDTVNIVDGKVFINGEAVPLEEPYLNGPMNGSFGPYVVPEDCYFMLGDNRNISKDSRYWFNYDKDKEENPFKYTFVKRDAIYAKAWLRYMRGGKLSFETIKHARYE